MRNIIYCRVSSVGQEKGASIEAQFETCKKHLGNSPISNYIRETSSAFNEMPPYLDQISKNKNVRLVIYSIDRFSRNMNFATELFQRMLHNNCELVFVNENLVCNKSNPNTQRFTELLHQSYLESCAISRRVKHSFEFYKSKGYYTSSTPPYGYSLCQDSINPKFKRLVPNENFKVIKFIYMCRTVGASVSEINSILGCDEGLDVCYDNKPIEHLLYPITYREISRYLNDVEIPYRDGKRWTSRNVSTVYHRYQNEQNEQNEKNVNDFVDLDEDSEDTQDTEDSDDSDDTQDTEDSDEEMSTYGSSSQGSPQIVPQPKRKLPRKILHKKL